MDDGNVVLKTSQIVASYRNGKDSAWAKNGADFGEKLAPNAFFNSGQRVSSDDYHPEGVGREA
ncbi:MAG: hypothetical protein RBU21_07920 [FCB group bacterium]|nr:hypothetical protein [FCB group bacterium]